MVKRKAKELESAGTLEEPRRSSRRISTAKEEPAPEKTSKPAPAPKKSNKTQTSNKGEDVKPGGKDEKGNTKDLVCLHPSDFQDSNFQFSEADKHHVQGHSASIP
jgi:hypothetical protein